MYAEPIRRKIQRELRTCARLRAVGAPRSLLTWHQAMLLTNRAGVLANGGLTTKSKTFRRNLQRCLALRGMTQAQVVVDLFSRVGQNAIRWST